MAQIYNDSINVLKYANRAQSYKNIFNETSGLMEPKRMLIGNLDLLHQK